MLIPHKGHTDTIQVYSVTVMTHVKALQAGHSSQGTSEPITPEVHVRPICQEESESCLVCSPILKEYSDRSELPVPFERHQS